MCSFEIFQVLFIFNSFYRACLFQLLGTLDSNKTLAYLDLSGNPIDPYLLNEIDSIVSSRQSRSKVRRGGEEPLDIVLQRLIRNDPSLTELLLDSKQLSNLPDTEPIFDALANNSCVTKLSLRNNGIDDGLVASLSLALVDNTSITHIWLNDNAITSGGCEYLLGTLDSNETVVFLDLGGNNEIEDDLVDEIQNAVSKNNKGNPSQSGDDSIDQSKPPMHEVAEESAETVAKRQAINAVMKDTSLSWPEKNSRILQLQQQHYIPPSDGNDDQQSAAVSSNRSTDRSSRSGTSSRRKISGGKSRGGKII